MVKLGMVNFMVLKVTAGMVMSPVVADFSSKTTVSQGFSCEASIPMKTPEKLDAPAKDMGPCFWAKAMQEMTSATKRVSVRFMFFFIWI